MQLHDSTPATGLHRAEAAVAQWDNRPRRWRSYGDAETAVHVRTAIIARAREAA